MLQAMNEILINSASYCFLGLFRASEIFLKPGYKPRNYNSLQIYKNSRPYFNKKYSSGWLDSLFNQRNHLQFNNQNDLIGKPLSLFVEGISTPVQYVIREINVYFFDEGLAIFTIKIDLSETDLSWEKIVCFGRVFKEVNQNLGKPGKHSPVGIIEKHITSKFHHNPQNWRKYNLNLKAGIFVDIADYPGEEILDELLYQLGTFSSFILKGDLDKPAKNYLKALLNANGICLFNNWKALCLHDSISRVAVNLKSVDTYRLWENEYMLIYVYVLFKQFYLRHSNDQITKMFRNTQEIKIQRNKFFEFRNKYDHFKVSHKFLPNIIYSKIQKSLELENEIEKIEDKLSRLYELRQERVSTRINRVLNMLTILTIISVANDAGTLFQNPQMTPEFVISISTIILNVSIIGFLIFWDRK